MKILSYIFLFLLGLRAFGQQATLTGQVLAPDGTPLPFATVGLKGLPLGTRADTEGQFILMDLKPGAYTVQASAVGYERQEKAILLTNSERITVLFEMKQAANTFDDVVISGTLNPVSRMESIVPVEIYTPKFFQRNPTPNIFEALQNVNGVRPQINCNVCNTGDIHINGLEGPYSMVLLDGMPIVSGLSTVYGLSGIPNSLIERVEIVKGPASSLYGSEAVGGLINIITKLPQKAPKFSANSFASGWGELNFDLGFKQNIGHKITAMTGLNYFNYSLPKDKNHDNFTDLTLQNRVSIFQKIAISQKNQKQLQLAARYFFEDRWGGEMNWTRAFRGTDVLYGESIFTNRWELLGKYELPTAEDLDLSFSFNRHKQNSFYGTTPFHAVQRIGFVQLVWNKEFINQHLLAGAAIRSTFYDDDTPGTASSSDLSINHPSQTLMPGIFIQDELKIKEKSILLFGYRLDLHPQHGAIHTPRIAFKFSPSMANTLRFNAGTGFRVVNVFTEDHAALTGARSVEIVGHLAPERSYNANLNYMTKIVTGNAGHIGLDITAFYTHFTNRIVPDYITDIQKIIYQNLEGHAVSKGISVNTDLNLKNGISLSAGATLMENSLHEGGLKIRPLFAERLQANWSVSIPITKLKLALDYTGNLYSPMKLPILGPLDPRPEYSPWWSIQNVQLTFIPTKSGLEFYGGLKNIFDFTPPANSIARANDPFDKMVQYKENGEVNPTADNPHALSFDPSYVFAPNQGRRMFLGLRYTLK